MNTDRLQEWNPATQSVENPTRTHTLHPMLDESLTTTVRRIRDSRTVNIIPQASDTSTTTNETTEAPSDQRETSHAISNLQPNFPSPFTSALWNTSDLSIDDRQNQYTNESAFGVEDENVEFTNKTNVPSKDEHSKYMNGSEIPIGDFGQGYYMDRSVVPEAASKDQRIGRANSQHVLTDVICPSAPGISPHPFHVENEFENEQRNVPGKKTLLDELAIIENSMRNDKRGQNPPQLQGLLQEDHVDLQSALGVFPESSLSDKRMMLSAGASQTLPLNNDGTNITNTDTTLLQETNGTMPTLNTGAISYSRGEDSTGTFNAQHPETLGSIREVPETSISEPNEREPEDYANAEAERNTIGLDIFPNRGIDRLDSQLQNETSDWITSVESPSPPTIDAVRADRPNASQFESEQAVRDPEPQNPEIDICDAKDAFYNYDWTLLSFSERRKRRTQILKSKRFPSSELRIKKTAANTSQKFGFGKVPDNVIIELSTAYPRQRPNRRKTRKIRTRMAAQIIRNKTRNHLEFHQIENENLLLKLSECNAQRLELTRQLERAQNRLRKREAEAANLRVHNKRLRTKMIGLGTRDRILLDH